MVGCARAHAHEPAARVPLEGKQAACRGISLAVACQNAELRKGREVACVRVYCWDFHGTLLRYNQPGVRLLSGSLFGGSQSHSPPLCGACAFNLSGSWSVADQLPRRASKNHTATPFKCSTSRGRGNCPLRQVVWGSPKAPRSLIGCAGCVLCAQDRSGTP